jgi:hypothetical protein
VQTRADTHTGEWLLLLETLADEAQDGHFAFGPLDALDAVGGTAHVGDVVRRQNARVRLSR